jgi:hypothetical protein
MTGCNSKRSNLTCSPCADQCCTTASALPAAADRIYITATQACWLCLGTAPAGPAGTGKTETTKDLSAQLGKPVYVFNCSPEMDYRTMGDIFKGLGKFGSITLVAVALSSMLQEPHCDWPTGIPNSICSSCICQVHCHSTHVVAAYDKATIANFVLAGAVLPFELQRHALRIDGGAVCTFFPYCSGQRQLGLLRRVQPPGA